MACSNWRKWSWWYEFEDQDLADRKSNDSREREWTETENVSLISVVGHDGWVRFELKTVEWVLLLLWVLVVFAVEILAELRAEIGMKVSERRWLRSWFTKRMGLEWGCFDCIHGQEMAVLSWSCVAINYGSVGQDGTRRSGSSCGGF